MTNKKKVLLVEKSQQKRDIILGFLPPKVVTTLSVSDGEKAIGAFKEGSFDLVISAWHLTDQTGLMLTNEIREVCWETPIILYDYHMGFNGIPIDDLIGVGINSVYKEPTDFEKLQKDINRLLNL